MEKGIFRSADEGGGIVAAPIVKNACSPSIVLGGCIRFHRKGAETQRVRGFLCASAP